MEAAAALSSFSPCSGLETMAVSAWSAAIEVRQGMACPRRSNALSLCTSAANSASKKLLLRTSWSPGIESTSCNTTAMACDPAIALRTCNAVFEHESVAEVLGLLQAAAAKPSGSSRQSASYSPSSSAATSVSVLAIQAAKASLAHVAPNRMAATRWTMLSSCVSRLAERDAEPAAKVTTVAASQKLRRLMTTPLSTALKNAAHPCISRIHLNQ
mmetsp:Transcript_64453/g.119907  ORF Transcript_64453/g.119907 Transcript_64453/m.119907 type:complete len:214 (+) Transcript_64453:398-1039(+)